MSTWSCICSASDWLSRIVCVHRIAYACRRACLFQLYVRLLSSKGHGMEFAPEGMRDGRRRIPTIDNRRESSRSLAVPCLDVLENAFRENFPGRSDHLESR